MNRLLKTQISFSFLPFRTKQYLHKFQSLIFGTEYVSKENVKNAIITIEPEKPKIFKTISIHTFVITIILKP